MNSKSEYFQHNTSETAKNNTELHKSDNNTEKVSSPPQSSGLLNNNNYYNIILLFKSTGNALMKVLFCSFINRYLINS